MLNLIQKADTSELRRSVRVLKRQLDKAQAASVRTPNVLEGERVLALLNQEIARRAA